MNHTARQYLEQAESYEADARSLGRKLASLDDDDPESREAARIWSEQLRHAHHRADDYRRYAERELNGY